MKILSDTGYVSVRTGIRCYYANERSMEVAPETTPEEIKSFLEEERKGWYGQEFSSRITDKRIFIRRGVDSG
jgi:hypothetical protein